MISDDNFEYVNEASISSELICTICQDPFTDPRIAECEHVFCNLCITDWMQKGNNSCPIDRTPISKLTHLNRPFRNLLNDLEVKCRMCGQTRLKRSDFDNHVKNVCPNTGVVCLAADIKCQWVGSRQELNNHMQTCDYQRMRPVLDQLIMENEHLKIRLVDINSEQNQSLVDNAVEINRLQTENNRLNEVNELLRTNATQQQTIRTVQQPNPRQIRWYNTPRSCVIHTMITIALLITMVVLAILLGKQSSKRNNTKIGWTMTGNMMVDRADHTASLLPDGNVLITGGSSRSYGTLNSVELYDPTTGACRRMKNMINRRSGHTASVLSNGKVLVTGGSNSKSAELYDFSTDIWTMTINMNYARQGHTASLLPNGKVLVAGGDGLKTAELYDPTTGIWIRTGNMSVARKYHTASMLLNGKVLVAGGYDTRDRFGSAELYDSLTGTWAMTGKMNVARERHTASILSNGKVLIAGGIKDGAYLNNCELFDPLADRWTNTGSMHTARAYHTASELFDGTVLVTGSYNHYSSLNSSELYDPATGNWIKARNMKVIRLLHTASVLLNGTVLVTGGLDFSNIDGLKSAELYGSMSSI